MIALSDAVRGTPEAAFWPTVASVIFYSNSPTNLNLIILIIMMIAGSMTYVTMRQVKTVFDNVADASKKRRRNRRDKGNNKDKIELIVDIFEKSMDLLPSSITVQISIALLIFTDIAGLFGFLYLLASEVLLTPDPNITLSIFTLLPVVYMFVICCVLIWNL